MRSKVLQQRFSSKGPLFVLSRVVRAGVVWHIWKEKNKRIFYHLELLYVLVSNYTRLVRRANNPIKKILIYILYVLSNYQLDILNLGQSIMSKNGDI